MLTNEASLICLLCPAGDAAASSAAFLFRQAVVLDWDTLAVAGDSMPPSNVNNDQSSSETSSYILTFWS